jgi:hypothetical protein
MTFSQILCDNITELCDDVPQNLEEIMSMATTYNWPLRHGGFTNCPMQPKAEGGPHGIRAIEQVYKYSNWHNIQVEGVNFNIIK